MLSLFERYNSISFASVRVTRPMDKCYIDDHEKRANEYIFIKKNNNKTL